MKCILKFLLATVCLQSLALMAVAAEQPNVMPGVEKQAAAGNAPGYEGEVPMPTHSMIRYGEHERQVLDFWKVQPDKPTPLVLVIHGGGWTGGDKERMSRFAGSEASRIPLCKKIQLL